MDNKFVCIGCVVLAIIVIYILIKKEGESYHQIIDTYQPKKDKYSENYEAIHTTPYSTYQQLVTKHPSTLTTEELESVIALDGIICRRD
jgi:hypothetical protein